MPDTPSQSPSPRAQRSAAPLGFRLPPPPAPAVSGEPWQVVERANGFHVSRESGSGATEFLRNEVRAVKVFRKRELAQAACAQANFTAEAARLSREPLMGGAA